MTRLTFITDRGRTECFVNGMPMPPSMLFAKFIDGEVQRIWFEHQAAPRAGDHGAINPSSVQSHGEGV